MHAAASRPELTRGRRHAQAADPARNEFQRDRDRIVHSTAFRRLVYKTQVFLNHEGDLFRTRLTHSLEVAQIARSIARSLGLNEDLVETISLAHDLGHTPFGHAGQDALNEVLLQWDPACGGFEHNLQSLRVVDELEERYADFDGLNLTWETREGILKHCSRATARRLQAAEPDGPAGRFLDGRQPSLEAQLCNLADEIAYNAHDIDDGVRSGLLTMEQLCAVPMFERFHAAARAQHPQLAGRRLLYETIRRMLSAQIYDVSDATAAALRELAPASPDDVRASRPIVRFGDDMARQGPPLKKFLRDQLYRHPQVDEMTTRARQVVRELFGAYLDDPSQLGGGGAADVPSGRARSTGREVADYIAGMTDRFAIREHERLTGRRLFA